MGQNIPPREIHIWNHSPSGKLYVQSRYKHGIRALKQEHLKDLESPFSLTASSPPTYIFRKKYNASLRCEILFRKQARKPNRCTERWTDLHSLEWNYSASLEPNQDRAAALKPLYLWPGWELAIHFTCELWTGSWLCPESTVFTKLYTTEC